jgi:hypothetical protein
MVDCRMSATYNQNKGCRMYATTGWAGDFPFLSNKDFLGYSDGRTAVAYTSEGQAASAGQY